MLQLAGIAKTAAGACYDRSILDLARRDRAVMRVRSNSRGRRAVREDQRAGAPLARSRRAQQLIFQRAKSARGVSVCACNGLDLAATMRIHSVMDRVDQHRPPRLAPPGDVEISSGLRQSHEAFTATSLADAPLRHEIARDLHDGL